ncbi:MAG: Isopentenyl-diphosphate Delta-isomerase [candidate division WS6 bacterium GW2011_GWA2_37_6]|uniref:Isopentenyl-diphosphate Delta-isomerase n=1 Tax=candidate division WS6 bacterium GW2011_GWA2_37_6 TaxID=1619087 RepID=A0A0G0H9M2_9BACT|nr:MAG: Isopentenyl-diphosphate Delta-isomerase [candidate division WS6 bacterium GW2011_GWA2_37_6]
MGFDCELKEIFSVRYNVKFSDGLSENEISHVFIGSFDDDPVMNPEEADDWQWITMEDLKKDIENNRGKYTLWFLEILPKMINYLKENPIKLSK